MPITVSQFEAALEETRKVLATEALESGFNSADQFELAVVAALRANNALTGLEIVHQEGSQNFPDIVIGGCFGVEVKYKKGKGAANSGVWREIGNSVFEGSRQDGVKDIFVMFCRMGATPEVRARRYEDAVYHVRTSHSPRFALSMEPQDEPLFGRESGINHSYEAFRALPDKTKMDLIKKYARSKHPNDWLWWVDDETGLQQPSELVIRNYTGLTGSEKRRLIAEAILLVPGCLGEGQGGKGKQKTAHYLRIGSYWLRAHSVYSGNIRDALTAGSVVDPCGDGIRMRCLVRHTLPFMAESVSNLSPQIIEEFWGGDVELGKRIDHWLTLADQCAVGWTPSTEFEWSEIKRQIRPA